LFLIFWVSVQTSNKQYNMQTPNYTAPAQVPVLDILQQFDVLLKNHSIVVSDRENLTTLFEKIVELCTQMPKTKLKAALKAATQDPKTKAQPKAKAQPKPKPKAKQEIMVGPIGAADAPMMSDLLEVPVARGRGRPRKAVPEVAPAAEAAANPNAETAEKKRRGRPKKDKTVTISSNDDEDALIEKMMADVATMQKDEDATMHSMNSVAESMSPVFQPASSCTQQFAEIEFDDEIEPAVASTSPASTATASASPSPSPVPTQKAKEVQVKAPAPKAKEVKAKAPAPKAKEVKAKEVKVKEVKVKEVKVKEVKVKEVKAKEVDGTPKPLASFSATSSVIASSRPETQTINGVIHLMPNVSTCSFTYNGKTYLRTELDNVYDNLTHEMIGVWDRANHEIIHAFDDDDEDDICFSDEE